MTKRFTALAISAMMTVPIFADSPDPFRYLVTAPGPDETSFTEIKVQFPDASDIEWIPGFFDRVNYYEITRDGEKMVYDFPQVYPDGNTLVFDIGSETSSDNRVELTMQPGFFRLLDSTEAEIGVNPLLHIVVAEGKAQSTLDYTFTSEPADPDGKLLLTSLGEARLTFPAIETVSADAGKASVSVGGELLPSDRYSVASGSGNTVTFTFSPALTSESDATVSILLPAGSLSGEAAGNRDTNTRDVCVDYTLVAPVSSDLTLDFHSPKPDGDGKVSATKNFSMSIFVCDVPGLKGARGSEPANVTLKETNGDYECSARLKVVTGMVTGKSTFYAEFEQPVYNGEYTVTIDKEAFGDTRWLSDPSMGRTNGPITLGFTLVDGEDRKAEPHIDLSLVKVTTEIAAVKGVPSEDDIYWYSNVTEKANYPGPQIWELLVENFFKAGAETFGMDWREVYRMTAKTGEHTWVFGDLDVSTDYVAYAFGLDREGNLYMPVTTLEFRTPDPIVSDNTFTLDVVSVEPGTQQNTKKVTLKVTPSNDDPYATVILDRYITDGYDLTPGSESEHQYLRNVLKPMIDKERIFNGEQTVVYDNVRIDAVMNAAVFGFEGEATTSATHAPFSTVDESLKAVSIEAYEPTITDASATAYSFDLQRPFIMGVISKASAEEAGGIENVHENVKVPYWEACGMGYYPWQQFAVMDLRRSAVDGRISESLKVSSLRWDTDYYVYAYLMDEGGYRTSPVYYDEFTTSPRNHVARDFELKINEIVSNAPVSPSTFTAEMEIIPDDKEAPYALYYGETRGFEEALEEDCLEDWMYDVFMSRRVKKLYSGDLDFGYAGVYADEKYILFVTGYDEAPNSSPAWVIFTSEGVCSQSEKGIVGVAAEGAPLRVWTQGREIRIDGDFVSAEAFSADGRRAGSFSGGACRVGGSGCYIVNVNTADGTETRKIFVR